MFFLPSTHTTVYRRVHGILESVPLQINLLSYIEFFSFVEEVPLVQNYLPDKSLQFKYRGIAGKERVTL